MKSAGRLKGETLGELLFFLIIGGMPFFRPVKTKKRSKRYDKVSHKCKVLLLKKVLCDHSEIKEVMITLYKTAEQL